jgi:hypothetical protein
MVLHIISVDDDTLLQNDVCIESGLAGCDDGIALLCLFIEFESLDVADGSAAALVVLTTVDGIAGYDPDGTPTTPKGDHWQSFDAGIACQTFCLAAYGKGLGTLIMGIFDEAKIAEILHIPAGERISALIAIGYPAVDPAAPKRKETGEILEIIG